MSPRIPEEIYREWMCSSFGFELRNYACRTFERFPPNRLSAISFLGGCRISVYRQGLGNTIDHGTGGGRQNTLNITKRALCSAGWDEKNIAVGKQLVWSFVLQNSIQCNGKFFVSTAGLANDLGVIERSISARALSERNGLQYRQPVIVLDQKSARFPHFTHDVNDARVRDDDSVARAHVNIVSRHAARFAFDVYDFGVIRVRSVRHRNCFSR